MRTRKRRKSSYSPIEGYHEPKMTSNKLVEPINISCQKLIKSIGERTENKCSNNVVLTRCNSRQAKNPMRNLPEIVVTIFYLSTCINLFSNFSPFQFAIIKPIYCERLLKLYQQPTAFLSHQTPFNTRSNLPEFIAQQGGIIKDKNVTLTKQYNPILITKDIVIKKGAKLTVESGTEILFEHRKGIIVHGTLELLGNPNDKIKLSLLRSQQSATLNFRSQNSNHLSQQQVRLVDGDIPSEGRVQIKFNDRWHSLCTSSKNLTAADIKVICHQVGYKDGNWYKWFPRRNDTTYQIMSKSFHCSGSETAINQCKRWNRIRTGGGVCNFHSDLGVRCSRSLVIEKDADTSFKYWRGLEFLQSETSNEYVLDGQMKQKVSRSTLRYVTITEAGLNEVGNATAAMRSYGQPPKMYEVEIKNSIYGMMIEDLDDAVSLSNIRLFNNMGYPLFLNTSGGKVLMDNIHIENNGGDGIRIVRHEKFRMGSHDFCKFANLGSTQSFPVTLSHEQTFFTSGRDCCQEFLSNNQLTVHFPVLRSTPNNLLPESDSNRRVSIPAGIDIGKDASLVIYDDYRDEYPFKLRIQNNTRAQSVVSKSGRLKICYEPANYRTVLFTIEVVTDSDDDWSGRSRDVEISNSFIKGNDGRGIWIDNQRSGIKISNATVINHNYVGGIHVENGTGEVIIQGSQVNNNTGHGIIINLAGGYYHIDNSSICDNTLKGILIDYDKNSQLVPFNHTVHIGYSLFSGNGENAVFIGNVCRSDAFWNISMNSFMRNEEDAIIFQSCLPMHDITSNFRNLTSRLNPTDSDSPFHSNYQDLYITHNVFLANTRRAISMAPVSFIKSFIRHNLFKDHQLAVIYISNHALMDTDTYYSSQAPVSLRIASNRFYSNKGRYVANIGLQEDNSRQSLIFTKNTLEENEISEPYADLKPRSRVSAVVVVSSSNSKILRNIFDNPLSLYDLGCHLEMHSKIINATTNFWGHGLDAVAIYKRIFDRKNRYNLAQVEFLQYLMSPEDLEYATDLSFDRERDKISTFKNGTRLGGEVKGYEELKADSYTVFDDIFVRPGGHLILKPGTILRFQDGVGVMVQGRIDALGQPSSPIMFISAVSTNRLPHQVPLTTTPAPLAIPWVSRMAGSSEDDSEATTNRNRKNNRLGKRIKKRQAVYANPQNVRLSHTTMGRLEVQIDGTWGSVCDFNFDIDDAAVVCQQLGMILNKDDWLLEKFQYAANDQQQISMMSSNVLMTNLRCDPSLDIDITRCKAEVSTRGEFDGLCNSEVGIRCFPPSWSGVRLGMGAETSTLEHVTIQRAGMFDYAAYSLKPALQIDFNRHWISSLNIRSNSDSGLGIAWNDVIGRHFSELLISDSRFLNNERHGVELRSRGLTIKNCTMSNNRQNGLDYNPIFSQKEINDLLSWLHTTKNSDNIETLTLPLKTKYFHVPSSESSYKIYIFQKNPQPDLNETFTIGTDPGHMLSILMLNPIHQNSTEILNMSMGLNPDSPIWDLRVNLTSFPMISPGYKFHLNYSSGSKPKGNIVLYIRSRYNNRDLKILTKYIPPHLVMPKFDQTAININSKLINSIVITDSTIMKNGIGLKFKHLNYPFDMQANYNQRYANETTNLTNNIIEGNHFSAIFVGLDDHTTITSSARLTVPASEIHYNVFNNKIRRNKDGIKQFSRDIRHTNNVFHWNIKDTLFDLNRGGGINVILPYFWRYDANLSHIISINNNTFLKNSQFEIILDGHYTVMNLTRNTFKENRCKNGLVSINGMEKEMLIQHNVIEHNVCNRIFEFDIQSHADKLGMVMANFEFNSMRYNRKLSVQSNSTISLSNFKSPKFLARLHPQATDYAISLRGVQNFNITRNLFVNPDLRFELVVAILMDTDGHTVNAVENYWGVLLQTDISDRIFDFDDWNNYALAQISPYLTQDSFSSATIIAEPRTSYHLEMSRPLGGRLTKSLTLPYRKEPYIVESDLTVMPNVKLTIEKGVTLEFMPNIGILVLGDLIAAGTREKPIQMRPMLSAPDIMPLYSYLFPPKTRPPITYASLSDHLSYEYNYAFKHHQYAYPIDMGSIRVCKNEICNDGSHIYENNVEDPLLRQEVLKSSNNTWKMDGFLEIFNMTTLQWVPVCDSLFTEHTARVVCRQLGYSHLSLFKRGRRYTIEQEQISSIKNWPESVQCKGDESSLSSCSLTPTGYTNHSTVCEREGNQFIYVYCQDFSETSTLMFNQNHELSNEHAHHWGGVRFSCPTTVMLESMNNRDSYNVISHRSNSSISRLQYVTFDRAGMLHRRKSPAVQILQCIVQMEYVAITNSAHHGLEVITSHGNQNFHQMRIRNNLGVGINYLSLTGSSSVSRLIPYLPLKHLDISSDVFGLVDLCGANKEIQIDDRLFIFYRYSSKPVDCLKILSSKLNIKHLGIRILQFNLFNSTSYTSKPDSVKIFDGDIFDRDSRLLVELGVTERNRQEKPELKFYQSTSSTLSIQLHVSGASYLHGFIAEIVTTPVSYSIQRDANNNVTFSEITNNKLGALSIYSAGESSPNLMIRNNRIESNCIHLFGNFTSCVSPIYMELQNCQKLMITNNLIRDNQGGLMVKSYSHSAVSALEAVIENNVFEGNQNTNTLALLGPKTDPYQTIKVAHNFFTRNVAQYLSNIVLSRIVANFSFNILSSNIGKHQIEVIGFDKLSVTHQVFSHNWIYNNTATLERDRSTIFANAAGQQYNSNYFVNPDNHFEISTMNWSRYDEKPYYVPRDDEIIHLASGDGSTRDVFRKTADAIPINIVDTKKLDLYHASITAKQNWWGFNTESAIQGRIRDRIQHEELIKVDFKPFLETNNTVLSGVCAGGWHKVGDACLVYVGSRMTYHEARNFCDRERASLPLLRGLMWGNHYEFSEFIRSQDRDFDQRVDRIWVRSFEVSRDACPALNDYRTRNYDCQDRYSFLCEKDPQIVVSLLHWHKETGGLVALLLGTITLVLALCCTVCWGYKSRHRYEERLDRRNSMYASMRASRASQIYNTDSSWIGLREDKNSLTDLSVSTQLTQPSNNGINHYPTGIDVGDHYPRSNNVINHYPTCNNIINHYPISNNIMNHYPPSNTVMNHYPPSNTVMNHYPPSNTVMNHYPPSNTVMDHYPASNDEIRDFKIDNNMINHYPAFNNVQLAPNYSLSPTKTIYRETSFESVEVEPAPIPPKSLFGSSQRISPVSSSFALSDSKHGSRVYLETSFE